MLNTLRFPAILLFLFFSLSIPTTPATLDTDRVALLAIKSQLHDPLRVTTSWNDSVPLCSWIGVSCGRRHQRVTALNFSNRRLEGRLSPFIGNLSFLRSIDVEGNNFYGEIPHEIGRLSRLEVLKLSNNTFSGTIPKNLSHCFNLIQFLANKNSLMGEIPSEIGYLSKLKILAIGENRLTGQLPASIGNLSALLVLRLRVNNLEGRVPHTLGQLKSLAVLNLYQNKFSGIFPPSVYNISSLESLFLISNRFSGSLPVNIGDNLPNLKMLNIAQNNFTGSLPYSLSNLSSIENLDVGENGFSGKVSVDFNRFENLSNLNLGVNKLGNNGLANDLEFLSSLTNCSKLDAIGLYKNQFGGVLPHSIANLSTTVTKIVMGTNQISGTIPPGIKNLVNLMLIGMEANRLTGTIPHEIGELKRLQVLNLNGNDLQGSIPTSLGNLTLLDELVLGSNNFQGNIPSSIANCQTLRVLVLEDNKLTGTVPPQIFGIITLTVFLGLSQNLLSGPLPSEVGSLKNLVALDVSRNHFSGSIPATLGGCTSLVFLHMQTNFFNGSIPSSLSSLKSLEGLELSSNNLSGQIPKFFQNLSFLLYVNLSYNHFEGEVPTEGIFSNMTNSSLRGNENLCGGLVQMHLPPCKYKGSKKTKTMLRLKVVIPIVVFFLILSTLVIAFVIRRMKSTHRTSRKLEMEEQFPLVSYGELSKATNEFSSSNVIGQGSYGLVYKGHLGEENGMVVAVKVINLQQKGASKTFMAECEVLRNTRHRNLIKIITVCSSIDFKGDDFKALVYEYMQNGSLEEWLHLNKDQADTSNLSVVQRLNIAIDVASSVEYLHHHCQPPIIHGDLKPSNVLLDHDMVAHVSDFGLAKFLSDHSISTNLGNPTSSTGIKGTIGYVAPEYGMSTKTSMAGDVYSFGILLLEMFTRRRPTDSMFNDDLTLHDFAKTALPERVMEIVDPSLLANVRPSNNNVENPRRHEDEQVRKQECLVIILQTGVLCSMESPTDRMQMTDTVAKLRAVRDKFVGVYLIMTLKGHHIGNPSIYYL